MSKDAFIKLVPASDKQEISIEDIKGLLSLYQSNTVKTGEQLSWGYKDSAFPYTIQEKEDANGQWFYLKGNDPRTHRYILIGVGSEQVSTGIEGESEPISQTYIQVTLTDISTHGDKGKANEFCKFLASKLKGELHLFNGRIMYYYPKK